MPKNQVLLEGLQQQTSAEARLNSEDLYDQIYISDRDPQRAHSLSCVLSPFRNTHWNLSKSFLLSSRVRVGTGIEGLMADDGPGKDVSQVWETVVDVPGMGKKDSIIADLQAL